MKRIVIVCSLLVFSASCGTSSKNSKTKEPEKKEEVKPQNKKVQEEFEEM